MAGALASLLDNLLENYGEQVNFRCNRAPSLLLCAARTFIDRLFSGVFVSGGHDQTEVPVELLPAFRPPTDGISH